LIITLNAASASPASLGRLIFAKQRPRKQDDEGGVALVITAPAAAVDSDVPPNCARETPNLRNW
jgi:hypothetical protein